MIAPGIERVDTIKDRSGYEMKSIWTRNDLIDTSITKLSTLNRLYIRLCARFKKRYVAIYHS